jgi:hypothetical protein
MAKKDETGMKRLAELAQSGSSRSPLYRWLHANHDEFMAMVEESRPLWKVMAEGFAEIGFRTADGKPLPAGTVRNTWWRVRRDVAKARAKKSQTPKPAAVSMPVVRSPLPSAPPVPAVNPAPAVTPAPDDPTDPERAKAAKEAFARMVEEMNHRSGRK